MSNENIGATSSSRKNAFYFGAFLALLYVTFTGLWGMAAGMFATTAPYVAGVAMFAGLLSIFGSMVMALKKVRRNTAKQAMIMDCFIATAVIGVAGFFLAACVQTFQPGGNPADLWTHGAIATAIFTGLFGGGKYMAELFIAGGK